MTPTTTKDDLQSWIGRTQEIKDLIALHQAKGMAAMLDRDDAPGEGDPLPPGWHWMFFPEIKRQSALGLDGHAARGEFLPPIQLPRRMWGGNRLKFHQPLRVGAWATRLAEVLSIEHKEGRSSGPLAFVQVKYSYTGAQGLALEEWHDIVYRAAAEPGATMPPGDAPPEGAVWRRTIEPDPVLLFRYSALTFNGHRIHYDYPYVTEEEGYPGLIVHGPLTASLLLDLIRREQPDEELAEVKVRARRPLFSGRPFVIEGHPVDGGCQVWAVDSEGFVAMTISAEYA